jgi:ribosome-associated toxin RatA of RatAB toxin-antitoxin module
VPVLAGSSSADVDAPIDRCWSIVEAVPRWPEWTSSFQTMDVVERDELGRALVCDAVSDAKVRKVRVRVRFSYEPPTKVSMKMIEGDLESMEGSWELQDLNGSRTRATYAVAIDLGSVGSFLRGPLKAMVVRLLAKRRIAEFTKRVQQA